MKVRIYYLFLCCFVGFGNFTLCKSQQVDSICLSELKAKIAVDPDWKAIGVFMSDMNQREAKNDFNFMNVNWRYISANLPKAKGQKLKREVYEKAGMTNVDEFLKLRSQQHKMFADFFKKYPEIKDLPQDKVLAIMSELDPARH